MTDYSRIEPEDSPFLNSKIDYLGGFTIFVHVKWTISRTLP